MGIHGPLFLSFTVGADVLVSVGDILRAGESNVKERNIEEVLGLLGLEESLSQTSKNILYERDVTHEEVAILEKVTGPVSDEKSEFSDGDTDETKDDSMKECYVSIENIGEHPAGLSYCKRNNKKVTKM